MLYRITSADERRFALDPFFDHLRFDFRSAGGGLLHDINRNDKGFIDLLEQGA